MKKLIKVLVVLLTMLTTQGAFAAVTDSVSVSYIGIRNNMNVIEIAINNSDLDILEVVLTDVDGMVIYSELVSSRVYIKRFMLNLPSGTGVILTVTSKDGTSVDYNVLTPDIWNLCQL
jgi:hypothetical protein